MIAAAERVLQRSSERTRIIPGHGPLASRADLQAYRDMLATVSARIREQVRAGRSPAEVIDSKPTAEFDAVWGKGFLNPQRFVDMLYQNLKQPR